MYTIELPDGTSITIDDNGEVVESCEGRTETVGTATTNIQNASSKTETPPNQDTSKAISTSKPTVASVKEKFGDYQLQADGEINTLIGHVKKRVQ